VFLPKGKTIQDLIAHIQLLADAPARRQATDVPKGTALSR